MCEADIEMERQEVDQQFTAMADDEKYLAFNVKLAEEFAESDWEALGRKDN